MRSVLALAALAAAGVSAPAQDAAAPAAAPKPGNYFFWYGPGPGYQLRLAVVKVADKGDVTVVAAGRAKPVVGKTETKAGRVTFPVAIGANDLTFDGAADPADPTRVLGTLGDANLALRAGLTPTDKDKLDADDQEFQAPPPAVMAAATQAVRAAGAAQQKARAAKDADEKKNLSAEAAKLQAAADEATPAAYRSVLKDDPNSPYAVQAAEALLTRAGPFKVTAEDAAKYVAVIEADAKKYGPRFEVAAANRLAATLSRSDALAPLALAVAKQAAARPGLTPKPKAAALKLLAAAQLKAGQSADAAATKAELAKLEVELDAETLAAAEKSAARPGLTPKVKAAALTALAAAQAKAGKTKEADATRAELAKLEVELDAEYKKAVPPFKPDAYAGRKDKAANKVAVMELFTGAQCPPCVAADVAFDALVTRYPAKDVVLLQYHLHIPGPDPLTNPDAVARFDYYRKLAEDSFGGTPAVALNGKPGPQAGGPMGNAKGAYDKFTEAVDEQLEQSSAAKLTGRAAQAGDDMTVTVEVAVKDAKDSVKLRLVLVEDEIKYVGGNGLRFHHHVVRGLLGTAAGVPVKGLKDGKHEVKTSLKDVRAGLTKYLADYDAADGPFPNANRPLDLAHLKVFALVQDDATGEILQAAELPLAGK